MVIGTHRYRNRLRAAALALLLAGLVPAIAEASRPAGRVISVSGDVTAVRAGESARSLHFRDLVREGDEIRTGPVASVQIRLNDGGLVELESASRFAIDRYGPDPDGTGSSALMRFLEGALRTVTGVIGDHPDDTYEMKTSIATIGVRGTGYSLEFCGRACAGNGVGDYGLYGRVHEGVIFVRTSSGSVDFAAGDYLFVSGSAAELPRPILRPPGGLLEGVDRSAGPASTTVAELGPSFTPRGALPPGLAGRAELPAGDPSGERLPSVPAIGPGGPHGTPGLPPALADRRPWPPDPARPRALPPGVTHRLPFGLP